MGVNFDGACVTSCPDGYYANGTECHYCHGTCATCTGGGYDECSTCRTTAPSMIFHPSLTPASGICGDSCLYNISQGGSGWTTHNNPPRFNNLGVCTLCHANCSLCFGVTASQCLSCPTGFVQAGYSCHHQSCPDGWNLDTGTSTCRQCPVGCRQCNSSRDTCTACMNGTFLHNGRCETACPANLHG